MVFWLANHSVISISKLKYVYWLLIVTNYGVKFKINKSKLISNRLQLQKVLRGFFFFPPRKVLHFKVHLVASRILQLAWFSRTLARTIGLRVQAISVQHNFILKICTPSQPHTRWTLFNSNLFLVVYSFWLNWCYRNLLILNLGIYFKPSNSFYYLLIKERLISQNTQCV